MKQTKLESYKGLLDCAQIAEGINASNANARRLATDAQSTCSKGKAFQVIPPKAEKSTHVSEK
ncbi:hypothetical protein [Pseudomonas fluorescens]